MEPFYRIPFLALVMWGVLGGSLAQARADEVLLGAALEYPANQTPYQVLTLPAVYLEAGESRFLSAEATVHGPAGLNRPILVSPKVVCNQLPGATTMANWEGADRAPNGVLVRVRTMLKAPAPGIYQCQLSMMSGGSGLPADAKMRIEAGGAKLRALPLAEAATPQEMWGTSVGEVSPGQPAYVLRRKFSVTNSNAPVSVHLDFQLSTCVPGSVARGWCQVEGQAESSTIYSRMFVSQLNSAGQECRRSAFPLQTQQVSNLAHHKKIFHDGWLTYDPSCSSNFLAWLYVQVGAGNPIHIETWTPGGNFYSSGLAVTWP